MALGKARVECLLTVIELLFLSLTAEALQGKMCQNSLPSGGGRSLGAKISEGRGRPWGIFFGFYKTRHILLSDSANCTVLRAVVLTQYRRVADGQTDRQMDVIAVASTAPAMRRDVTKRNTVKNKTITCHVTTKKRTKRTNSSYCYIVHSLIDAKCILQTHSPYGSRHFVKNTLVKHLENCDQSDCNRICTSVHMS